MFAHCDTLPPASLNEHVPGAGVAKLAYAQDLKSCGSQGRVGSSPTTRTKSPSGDGSTVSAKSDQPSEGALQGECQPDDMILSNKAGLPKGLRKRGSVYQVDLSIEEGFCYRTICMQVVTSSRPLGGGVTEGTGGH